MSELRWILLAAGVVLLAVIYVLGVRARRRSASPADERFTPREAARTPARQAPPRVNDESDADEATELELPPMEAEPEPDSWQAPEPVRPVRRTDREADPAAETERTTPPRRREPTLGTGFESTRGNEARPVPEMSASRREPAQGHGQPVQPESAGSAEKAPVKSRSKIVALRVSAPLPTRFSGAQLLEALQAEQFEFGRFDIFHRLDDQGRPVFSLANLVEPGTFDPATMQEGAYPGVALFAVLPGPLPAVEAFDLLVATAKGLAARLGGSLQDERGGWLSAQRIASLREELLASEPSASAGGGT